MKKCVLSWSFLYLIHFWDYFSIDDKFSSFQNCLQLDEIPKRIKFIEFTYSSKANSLKLRYGNQTFALLFWSLRKANDPVACCNETLSQWMQGSRFTLVLLINCFSHYIHRSLMFKTHSRRKINKRYMRNSNQCRWIVSLDFSLEFSPFTLIKAVQLILINLFLLMF